MAYGQVLKSVGAVKHHIATGGKYAKAAAAAVEIAFISGCKQTLTHPGDRVRFTGYIVKAATGIDELILFDVNIVE